MRCKTCGEELAEDARICKSCGTVNLESSEVKNLLGNTIISSKTGNPNYTIDMTTSTNQDTTNNNIEIKKSLLGYMPTTEKVMWIFNLVLLVISIIGTLVASSFVNELIQKANSLGYTTYINIDLNVYLIPVLIGWFITSTTIQKLLMKSGKPWWGFFIPIYNVYIILRLGYDSPGVTAILFILLPVLGGVINHIIPVVYPYYSLAYSIFMFFAVIVYWWKLGRNFGGSRLLTVLFSPIMCLIFAYSSKFQYFGTDGQIY